MRHRPRHREPVSDRFQRWTLGGCDTDGPATPAPTGAPTSPRLSNLVNHRLDARMEALARCYGMSYSRYADDLTLSGAAIQHFPHHNPKTLAPVQVPPISVPSA
mgnify:CR=1 FL=1